MAPSAIALTNMSKKRATTDEHRVILSPIDRRPKSQISQGYADQNGVLLRFVNGVNSAVKTVNGLLTERYQACVEDEQEWNNSKANL